MNSELFREKYLDSISKVISGDKIGRSFSNKLESKASFNYNFVDGPFIEIKNAREGQKYHVEFRDEMGNLHYSSDLYNNMWSKLNRKYYTKWNIKAFNNGETVLDYTLNYQGKRVYISLESSSIGDTLAWLPYAEEFRKKHDCHVIVSTFHNRLFIEGYPNLEFINPGESAHNIEGQYRLGWFYDDSKEPEVPNTVPLQKSASNILGLDFKEIRPVLSFDKNNRPHNKKYVAISISSTSGCKEWELHKWQELVDYLKSLDYDVAVIQKDKTDLVGILDWTGPDPLEKRMNQLYHAEFFIGLGSGISWLSWAVGTHVVMIANFSEEGHEFTENTTRITNKSVCNSCWNNKNFKFDKGDWYWCPINKGTDRQFECHKSITSQFVIEKIKHLIK